VADDIQVSQRTDVVQTTNGPIRGYREDKLHVFKGVRYGAPPIGALRFKPPVKPQAWADVADAVALGNPAVQGGSVPGKPSGGTSGGDPAAPGQPLSSEDCLFLNVWTQGLGGKRPVMVWLHGGGFSNGSGGAAMYDGGNLARRGDVVTVTVNHRLNVFGYLHLGDILGKDYESSGQAGMLDIVLVLEWVRDNIAKFGGDPGNVTIFGESGGGAKVSMLLAMPPAKGLFHKAIIQSGPGLRAVPRERATMLAKTLLDQLGVKDAKALQDADGAAIAKAAAEAPRNLPRSDDNMARNASFSPCIDGAALTRDPFVPDAPAQSKDIPVMIGTNKDESTLFMRGAPDFGSVTEEKLLERTKRSAGDKAEKLLAALRAIYPDYTPTYLQSAVQTAQGMWMGSIQLAERKAAQNGAPVYMYMLTWETPVARGALKSPHALEIPLVMDNVERARDFVGRGDAPVSLAEQMAPAWLAFAKTGNPNHGGVPAWPAYDAKTRATMLFNLESKIANDPNAEVRKILAN
jgi:para-nitrobenzyl esterase